MDTRFHDGYLWVSDEPNGNLGLCLPGSDPEAVARLYLRNRLQYYNRGRTFTVYIQSTANADPIRVDIAW